MKIDYIAICNCGFEIYDTKLVSIKSDSKKHLKDCSGEVYVDRCIDNEIDESFKSIKLKAGN